MWPAIIRTVRRGAPGTMAAHSSGGRCSIRKTVTRLVVLHTGTRASRRARHEGFTKPSPSDRRPRNGSRLSCRASAGRRKRPALRDGWPAGKRSLPLKAGPGSFKRMLGRARPGLPELPPGFAHPHDRQTTAGPIVCHDGQGHALAHARLKGDGQCIRVMRKPDAANIEVNKPVPWRAAESKPA